jgi:hypothetical protein
MKKNQEGGSIFRLSETLSPVSILSPTVMFGTKKPNKPGVFDPIVRNSNGDEVVTSPVTVSPRAIRANNPVFSPLSLSSISPVSHFSPFAPIRTRPLWDPNARYSPDRPTVVTFNPPKDPPKLKIIHPTKGAYDLKNVRAQVGPFFTKLKFGEDRDEDLTPKRVINLRTGVSKPFIPAGSNVPKPFVPSGTNFKNTWSWNGSNLIRTHSGNTTTYSGAGIFIIEEGYLSKQPAVILFQNRSNNKYEDLGGGLDTRLDAGESVLNKTAQKESLEESCCAIDLENLSLDRTLLGQKLFVDSDYQGTKYRAFMVGVKAIPNLQTMFQQNKTQIDRAPQVPADFKETFNIARVPLNNLFSVIETSPGNVDIQILDENQRPIVISSRANKCLKDMFNGYRSSRSIVQTVVQNPIVLNQVMTSRFGLNLQSYKF